jgi:hypothetical protein
VAAAAPEIPALGAATLALGALVVFLFAYAVAKTAQVTVAKVFGFLTTISVLH